MLEWGETWFVILVGGAFGLLWSMAKTLEQIRDYLKIIAERRD